MAKWSVQAPAVAERYDVVTLTLQPDAPLDGNPFDFRLRAEVTAPSGRTQEIDGFADGDHHAVRLMPEETGNYAVRFFWDGEEVAHTGTRVTDSSRPGPIEVDPFHPWHFRYRGTNEPAFIHSTTAYAMVGLREDLIPPALERLAGYGVNRIRAALFGPRVKGGDDWFEPAVQESDEFTFRSSPWPCAQPESVGEPGYDTSRFDVAHWRKFERLLHAARRVGIAVSVIFFVDGQKPGNDPFKGDPWGEDAQRYYRYAVARLAAFTNVEWCLANEYHLFRDEAWVEQVGAFVRANDPYRHLISVHGHPEFPFRGSTWADFACFQSWDETGGHGFMLEHRAKQLAAGGPKPQVNDEYGYEDHYPQGWGGARDWPARTPDDRRRLAWEIAMAGGYQSTGERADTGAGGWINGRGDASMTMLDGYAKMVAFFTAFPWYRMSPADEVVTAGHCLADPGYRYAVYLPEGGTTSLDLPEGAYVATAFDPLSGHWRELGEATGTWNSPKVKPGRDAAFLIEKR